MKTQHLKEGFLENITGRRRGSFALRMAPMIDMIFLLLIFFLVAAKWRPAENFLPFKLPAAYASETRIGAPEPLLIYVSSEENGCTVAIGQLYNVSIDDNDPEQDLALLMEKMEQCLEEQKRYASDPVEIICSPDAKWQYIARIYNVFFGAGLTDITFQMTE